MATGRLWGTAVLMPGGPDGSTRVMQLGGSPTLDGPTERPLVTTEIFDESNQGLGLQAPPPMQVGRAHHNTVLLPDGSMVTVGGGYGYRRRGQLGRRPGTQGGRARDPATGQWRLGPAQAENRAYHSTALLLPDGRVVSAGDDSTQHQQRHR